MNKKGIAILSISILCFAVIITGCSKDETGKKPETQKQTGQSQSTSETKNTQTPAPTGTKLPFNPAASKIEWEGKKVTGKHYGNVNMKSGDIYVDGGKISGGNFEIDFTTIQVTDLKDPEMNAKLTNHLKSDDFFSAGSHPTGKFVITSVEPVTDSKGNNAKVNGTLTIKGITKPISFPANIKIENGKVSATADVLIDRTQWDIKFRSGKFFENLGDNLIYDDFNIRLNILAGA